MREFILAKDELNSICELIKDEGIVLLQGDLASGKTSLVKAIARYKGVREDVSSPTFSIMQSYQAKNTKIYHYDIYQNGLKALLENGLFENFFEKGLHLVEWAQEDLEAYLLKFKLESMLIKLSTTKDENKRKYKVYEHFRG